VASSCPSSSPSSFLQVGCSPDRHQRAQRTQGGGGPCVLSPSHPTSSNLAAVVQAPFMSFVQPGSNNRGSCSGGGCGGGGSTLEPLGAPSELASADVSRYPQLSPSLSASDAERELTEEEATLGVETVGAGVAAVGKAMSMGISEVRCPALLGEGSEVNRAGASRAVAEGAGQGESGRNDPDEGGDSLLRHHHRQRVRSCGGSIGSSGDLSEATLKNALTPVKNPRDAYFGGRGIIDRRGSSGEHTQNHFEKNHFVETRGRQHRRRSSPGAMADEGKKMMAIDPEGKRNTGG
ncbi:unnamed protein product, partial [Discosporangium mesarthrocarpum]